MRRKNGFPKFLPSLRADRIQDNWGCKFPQKGSFYFLFCRNKVKQYNKMGVRSWILKIHLYGGLLCFWYLLIFAFSSLHYHHDFDFMKESEISNESRPITFHQKFEEGDSALAINLQNELNLAGWYLFWETYTDSSGIFHTEIQNPKTTYRITYDRISSSASIESEYKGFWSVVNALHGFAGKMPNAPFMIFWHLFTYVCMLIVIFSIASGIWLWLKNREDKVVGWAILIGMMTVSFLLLLTTYLKG